MKSDQLREEFLEFFRSKDHTVVPSDSLVPANDPSLLFTGAGMNQFKDHFLGLKREMKRAASVQKCFRTGDVEQVGRTSGHLTFFEMLGNFSFGDYFKQEAIPWAWEFLTEHLEIPKDRLWATVYESDEEAASVWKKEVGLPQYRIIRMGAKDNFWPSNAPAEGPNGPCGPCSELHYDYQQCTVGKTCPDPKRCKPGCPCGRFVEVWNLVFTQYDRQPDGSLEDLPAKGIDTGMGLERLAAVAQGKVSVFETDLFEPIVAEIAAIHSSTSSSRKRGSDSPFRGNDGSNRDPTTALCAIADHARALTFLVSDGVVPSNDGRGYVLRMLLRKAARAGRALGLSEPFLHALCPAVAKSVESVYPELTQRRESIARVILLEEERFQQMLEEKLPLLREQLGKALSADRAAQFYDTHGLSYEEIAEVCSEQGVPAPSRPNFETALRGLQAKSKAAGAFGAIFARDELVELTGGLPPTAFVGYGPELGAETKVMMLVQERKSVRQATAPEPVEVVLGRSPFYGEAGGQVGDAGELQAPEGKARVLDTQWVGGVLVHRAQVLEGRLRAGDPVTAAVDRARRQQVARNHTATHLLHAALRKVLGGHVMQAGSLVAPDRLRLDFSHGKGLTGAQREAVESLTNEWVMAGFPVSVAQMPLEEARRTGAVALFGEKYGAQVRVVSIGQVSRELCGGTHLVSSNQVGLLTLVGEGSVAAGVRRVEALTGPVAFTHLQKQAEELQELAQMLRSAPQDLPAAIERLTKRTRELEEQLVQARNKTLQGQAQKLAGRKVGSFTFFAKQLPERLDHGALRTFADAIRKGEPEAVIFLADSEGFCVAAAGKAAQAKGVPATELLKLSNEVAGGSGGGRPDLAQGRVSEAGRFRQIRSRLEQFLTERSGNSR